MASMVFRRAKGTQLHPILVVSRSAQFGKHSVLLLSLLLFWAHRVGEIF
jgi:hypothetical protein